MNALCMSLSELVMAGLPLFCIFLEEKSALLLLCDNLYENSITGSICFISVPEIFPQS